MGHGLKTMSDDGKLIFPYVTQNDSLQLTSSMEKKIQRMVIKEPNGCLTIPRGKRIRLINGKRIQLRKYIYMRCVTDILDGYTRLTCAPRNDGRECVSPEHYVRKMVKQKDSKDRGGLFGDLPEITATKKVVVLENDSRPEMPEIKDCFSLLTSKDEVLQIYNSRTQVKLRKG